MSSISMEDIKRMMEEFFKGETFLQIIENAVANAVDKKVREMEEKVQNLADENEILKETINDLEQYGRRNNLRIYGLNKNKVNKIEEIDLEKEVVKEINLKMRSTIVSNQIEACHYLDKNKSSVIVRFGSRKTRDFVFSNKKLLKGTQISIAEDLTKKNYNLLKECQKVFDQKNLWTHNGNVKLNLHNKIYNIRNMRRLQELKEQK